MVLIVCLLACVNAFVFLVVIISGKSFLEKEKYRIYNAVLFDTKFMFYDITEIPRKVVSVMNYEKTLFFELILS